MIGRDGVEALRARVRVRGGADALRVRPWPPGERSPASTPTCQNV